MFDWAVLLQGEIKPWSLLGVKGLPKYRLKETSVPQYRKPSEISV